MKIDDSLKEDILAEIGSIFNLKQCDVGKFNKFNYPRLLRVFKFSTEQYKVENPGDIAILNGTSLLGMSIFTAVITPEKGIDLPLLIIANNFTP